jgi:hypothetical protein
MIQNMRLTISALRACKRSSPGAARRTRLADTSAWPPARPPLPTRSQAADLAAAGSTLARSDSAQAVPPETTANTAIHATFAIVVMIRSFHAMPVSPAVLQR